MELYTLTLHQAMGLLASGDVTSVALTESVLARIDTVDDKVRAYLHLDREGALRQAEQADQQRKQGQAGALCGLPMSLKDNLCTLGQPTTCASRMLESFMSPYEATAVAKLRQEGVVLLGKLAMDEFAMGSTSETCAFQIPNNPWKTGYVCGGSSGGSAAAVAADTCLAALGTDTGGSIRQPASLCGTVGLKPSYGRVSRHGAVAFASSLDQIGPLTKDVRDCALLLNHICGYDPQDSTSAKEPVPDFLAALQKGLDGIRIGLPAEYFAQGLDPEVDQAVRRGIDILRNAGAEVVEISMPHTEYCVAVYYLISAAEASSNLARFDGVRYGLRNTNGSSLLDMYEQTRSRGFGDEVKRRILIGTYALSAGYYDAYYKKASQVRTLIQEDYNRAFAQCDLIASPVVPTPAWKIGEKSDDPISVYLSDILTISSNLAGVPAISVPCGFSSQGLPIGFQLQAAFFQESSLLRTAWNLELAAGIVGQKPAIV